MTSGALTLRAVGKSYALPEGPLTVLKDIQLEVEPGQFVCIVGASGCGKSTLLRLIVGLEQDYEGEIQLDGQRVSGTSLDRGIVFQDHRLFPWMTVEQNVAIALINHDLSKAEKARRVREHIALVNLSGFEKAYPHQLSGGMAQRAAIARVLVNQPKILLLDEPFGALDALTRVYLQRELQRIWLRQRSTVLMVTHDVDEALFLADRLVVMDARPGRIRRIVPIPLPHPRDRTLPVLQRIKEQVLFDLTGESDVAAPEPDAHAHAAPKPIQRVG
jgi:ABC-type nitrate/sulfonate/bicarbonate transport system ATPase subunit